MRIGRIRQVLPSFPESMQWKGFVAPLCAMSDEKIRETGLDLGIPCSVINAFPFPEAGLAVRIIGEVTREKVEILRRADTVFLEEISCANLKNQPGQCFAVLSDMKSVGVMGDFRTYDYAVILRAVVTADFVTAKASELPWEVLFSATNRIVNEVNGINRVLYDCTGKPTAAIEWC